MARPRAPRRVGGCSGAGGRRVPNIADLQEPPEPRRRTEEPAGRGGAADGPEEEHRRWSTRRSPTRPLDRRAPGDRRAADGNVRRRGRDRGARRPRRPAPPTRSWSTPRWPSRGSPRSSRSPSLTRRTDELLQRAAALRRAEPGARGRRSRSEPELPPTNSTTLAPPPADEAVADARRGRARRGADEEPEHERGARRAEPTAARPPQHEDVLEDTPEFLEDTPEDDELWFEQKPPKDFDFDD